MVTVTILVVLASVILPRIQDDTRLRLIGASRLLASDIELAQMIRLDVLIQHRSEERLPGITVDISMIDSSQAEKGHWRVWFDTSDVTKATVTQFTHVLEDVGYEEGDGFFLEVRHPVPVEERGEYREFSTTP